MKVKAIFLVIFCFLTSCDAGIILCGRYICVAGYDDCFGGHCDDRSRRCESAGLIRDRIPQILDQLRVAQRTCAADHQLAESPETIQWNTVLAQAATRHARDMASNDFISFIGTDSSTTESRVPNSENDYDQLKESILGGVQTSASAINSWLDVETDCRQLLDADLTEVGAACATAPNYDRGPYWSLLLGDPKSIVE